jgi:hypothetical protein
VLIQPLHREGSEEKCSFHGSKGWSENFKNMMRWKRSEESPFADHVTGDYVATAFQEDN